MTVTSSEYMTIYAGLGTTGPYTYPHRVLSTDDIAVEVFDAAGDKTTLSYPADYAVTGLNTSSLSIVTTAAVAAFTKLVISANPVLEQDLDLRNETGFHPDTLEDALDRSITASKSLKFKTDRALTIPLTETTDMQLPSVASRANKWLGFNASGEPTTITATSVGIDGATIGGIDSGSASPGEVRIGGGVVRASIGIVSSGITYLFGGSVTTGSSPSAPSSGEVRVGNGIVYAGTALQVAGGSPVNWGSAGSGGYITGFNGGVLGVYPATHMIIYGATPATPTTTEVRIGYGYVHAGTALAVAGNIVVGAKKTGWTAPTGAATRTSFATGSVTLQNLAQAVKALIDDLTSHGLIGA